MTDVLYVGDRALGTDEIPTLLKRYELLPKFIEALAIEEAIAEYECTPEEKQQALLEICQRHQLTNLEQQQQWMDERGLDAQEVELMATRSIRIQKYKEETWGKKVRRNFMERKSGLDTVTYSLIRTQDAGLAHELYYRILEGEVSFEECATAHSQGPEARTSGRLGPVPLNRPHPLISKLLSVSTPGQLWPPRTIPQSEWQVIIRLEELVPAQLDDKMRQALLDDLYNTWLQERVKELQAQVLSPAYQAECADRQAADRSNDSDTSDDTETGDEAEASVSPEGAAPTDASSANAPTSLVSTPA
ncbi:MAG: peptidylprolyl isomerase [Geitlerinemataceae cyanobacterium]